MSSVSEEPVLFYRSVSMAYSVTGVGEAAARLPPARWVGARADDAAHRPRWFGSAVGVFGGPSSRPALGYFAVGRVFLPDSRSRCSSRWRHGDWSKPSPRPSDPTAPTRARGTGVAALAILTRRWWIVPAGQAIGLGMLTKGPVARGAAGVASGARPVEATAG